MSETVKVLPLGGHHEYAAEVHEGNQTTEHRVVFAQDLLDDLVIADADESALVVEAVKYMLQEVPSAGLPHDIDLEDVRSRDAGFVPELRARLTS
ncbi:hypothetical protein FHX42_001828 [Saccharopolyspora lacisalsi]|uniref:Uncharacterized protein n=1 Tax=Halosaccharopolyspora lacisalsi TaxID=1000566 RepID=A0A839DZ37_9PSEU|nr:hypothetical protein [Halosaccharopolyspora lacisalsi]MBA8824481.1 hypothetical protein [Halosaccharopolyspora lacisalsi]